MKIAIIGAGAMGSLFACLLHRAGNEIWLIDKDPQRVSAVRQFGIVLEDAAGTHREALATITERADAVGVVELVIVCVKAYDTAGALDQIRCIIGANTLVLSLQNGLYNLETIAAGIDTGRLLGGITSHGATLLTHGRVRHAGSGDTVIGAFGRVEAEKLHAVAAVFNRAGIRTLVTDELAPTLWRKLIINAAINPLTALTGLPNGELILHPGLVDLQERIVAEACAVARSMGIVFDIGEMAAAVREVCQRTAANISSMLQDVRSGRRTEIDAINGALVKAGMSCAVPTPYNAILTALVKAVEAERGRRADT